MTTSPDQFPVDCDSMYRAALTLSSEYDWRMSDGAIADFYNDKRTLLMEIDRLNLEPDQIPADVAEAIAFLRST